MESCAGGEWDDRGGGRWEGRVVIVGETRGWVGGRVERVLKGGGTRGS